MPTPVGGHEKHATCSMVSWVTSTSPAMLTRESLSPDTCVHGSVESADG